MYANNLKQIRKSLNLSVAKFAQKLEMSANTLTGYERGVRTPSVSLFIQLYKKLNVNLNWFVSGEGEMFNSQNTININNDMKFYIRNEVKQILSEEGLIKN